MKSSMKKVLALLLVAVICVAFAACKGGTEEPTKAPESSETAAPENTDKPEAPADGTEVANDFWSVTYTDAWTYNEEDDLKEGSDYANIEFTNAADDDLTVFVELSYEDCEDYREFIMNSELDEKEVVENGAGEYAKISGRDFLIVTGKYYGDDCTRYLLRDSDAGATAMIRVIGDAENADVKALISTVEFKITRDGEMDPPWYWAGEPMNKGTNEVMCGTTTYKATQLVFDDYVMCDDIFSGRVAVNGSDVYTLCDNVLSHYTVDGDKITFDKVIELDKEYKEMQFDKNGNLWLSNFMKPLICLKDGEIVASYDDIKYAEMAPDGTWGISYFTGNEVEKFTISGDIVSKETVTLDDIKMVSAFEITDDEILITGSKNDEEGNHCLFVYDHSLNLKSIIGDCAFGEEGHLASVTEIIAGEKGYFLVDGNFRNITLYSKDGECMGEMDSDDLFGCSYPWMSCADELDDGRILVGMTQERDDKSCDEFVLFAVEGF